MLWPKPNVLLFDPADGLDASNRWVESSGNGLNALPGAAYVTPAYGLALGPSGAPYILAGGTANYNATLPLGFYTRAPTTAMTVCLVQRFTSPLAADIVFSCADAGNTRGFAVDFVTAERLRLRGYDAAGAFTVCLMTADGPLSGRTRVVVLAMEQAGSLAMAWVDGQGVAASFAGSLNPIAYNTAIVPTLWSLVGGGQYNDASVYWFSVDNRAWTDGEVKAWSAWALNKV